MRHIDPDDEQHFYRTLLRQTLVEARLRELDDIAARHMRGERWDADEFSDPVANSIVTAADAAKLLGISTHTIYRRIAAGDIYAVKLGDRGAWLCRKSEIDRCIAEGHTGHADRRRCRMD